MIIKHLSDVSAFVAADATLIKEVLHPKNDQVDLSYSLAYATLEAGAASKPHALKISSEVYIFVEGSGEVSVGEEQRQVKNGDVVLVPAGVLQHVKNTGKDMLRFLCVVSPPWRAEDEEVMENS